MILRLTVVAMALLAGAGFIARESRMEPVPIRKSFAEFPMDLAGWRGQPGQPFDPKILAVLGVDEYANLTFTRQAHPAIGLYVGYYQSQREGDTIHSPLNCLPGAGWEPVAKGRLEIPVSTATGARTLSVNRYVIQKGVDRQLVVYWYQSHGRVVASEYASKVYLVWDAVRSNRSDAALVRVITPVPDGSPEADAAAERRAIGFVQGLFPRLSDYLPS